MKVWISKYALSKGVYEEEVHPEGDGIVSTRKEYWFYPGEWHKDRASAIKAAEAMRRLKIADLEARRSNLDKRIAKLQALRFEKTEQGQ